MIENLGDLNNGHKSKLVIWFHTNNVSCNFGLIFRVKRR